MSCGNFRVIRNALSKIKCIEFADGSSIEIITNHTNHEEGLIITSVENGITYKKEFELYDNSVSKFQCIEFSDGSSIEFITDLNNHEKGIIITFVENGITDKKEYELDDNDFLHEVIYDDEEEILFIWV